MQQCLHFDDYINCYYEHLLQNHFTLCRNNVSDRLHQVIQCSIQEASQQLKQTGFNFIVSNPPYIKTEEILNLQPEIVK